MQHSFNAEVAEELNVNKAIFINNIIHWISKNSDNNRHFYDGRYWTYNSMDAFRNLLSYFSYGQIRKIIDDLVKDGVIIKGNFNKLKYDRTCWYSFTDEWFVKLYKLKCSKIQIDLLKNANGDAQKCTPIPDINTDINTDINVMVATAPQQQQKQKKSIKIPYEEIVDIYTSILVKVGMCGCANLSDSRKSKIRSFWIKAGFLDLPNGLAEWGIYCNYIRDNCTWMHSDNVYSNGIVRKKKDLFFIAKHETYLRLKEGGLRDAESNQKR